MKLIYADKEGKVPRIEAISALVGGVFHMIVMTGK